MLIIKNIFTIIMNAIPYIMKIIIDFPYFHTLIILIAAYSMIKLMLYEAEQIRYVREKIPRRRL